MRDYYIKSDLNALVNNQCLMKNQNNSLNSKCVSALYWPTMSLTRNATSSNSDDDDDDTGFSPLPAGTS